jgi:alpha-galactosidase
MLNLLVALAVLAAPAVAAEFSFKFDAEHPRWDVSNGLVRASFSLTERKTFELAGFVDLTNSREWKPPAGTPVSPINFRFDRTVYNSATTFELVKHSVERPNEKHAQQIIVLKDTQDTVRVRLEINLYAGHPVIRQNITVTNLRGKTVFARAADMLPYDFAAQDISYRLFRVNQWAIVPTSRQFEISNIALRPDVRVPILSGARGERVTWLAMRDGNANGLFAGWEFDGRCEASVRLSSVGTVQIKAPVSELYHPVGAGEKFEIPAAFIGFFQGDFNEAGFRTQRFIEDVLAPPMPTNFPYISWDSWGWGPDIHEDSLRREAELAAALGVELFLVDLGWARSIGDWREDPQKFPSGLRALSDYVHSLGMKFGLHFAFAEAAPDAPVLQENPDWRSSETYFYHGAESLCLSNEPTKRWIIAQALRMVDEYKVDWILQDGEQMVKFCDKTTHTHHPRDSNYANSVQGLNAVVEEIRRLRPEVMWENCENGGAMMTFKMVRNYVTSITNDASGAESSRKAVFGATYPFPPRFADRYMPEYPDSTYLTRSYMFGGPWHLMFRLVDLTFDQMDLLARETQLYKKLREHIRTGKVYHIAPPDAGKTDVIESYDAGTDSAIALVTRNGSEDNFADVRLRGLTPARSYRISFQDDSRELTMTGEQIQTGGIRVYLPAVQSAEVIYIRPLR